MKSLLLLLIICMYACAYNVPYTYKLVVNSYTNYKLPINPMNNTYLVQILCMEETDIGVTLMTQNCSLSALSVSLFLGSVYNGILNQAMNTRFSDPIDCMMVGGTIGKNQTVYITIIEIEGWTSEWTPPM